MNQPLEQLNDRKEQ